MTQSTHSLTQNGPRPPDGVYDNVTRGIREVWGAGCLRTFATREAVERGIEYVTDEAWGRKPWVMVHFIVAIDCANYQADARVM